MEVTGIYNILLFWGVAEPAKYKYLTVVFIWFPFAFNQSKIPTYFFKKQLKLFTNQLQARKEQQQQISDS